MLISFNEILDELNKYNIKIKGILHIGAHDCEENELYSKYLDINDNIIWIDAMDEKVQQGKQKGIKYIYQAVISDIDNQQINFNITNNIQSSSIFELGTHLKEHPWVNVISKRVLTTTTIDTFIKHNNIDITTLNFWNFDIQGAELNALKGGRELLKYVDVLYLEVNVDYLYKGCALMTDIDDFLKEYQFTRVITNITQHGWGDALYIKK